MLTFIISTFDISYIWFVQGIILKANGKTGEAERMFIQVSITSRNFSLCHIIFMNIVSGKWLVIVICRLGSLHQREPRQLWIATLGNNCEFDHSSLTFMVHGCQRAHCNLENCMLYASLGLVFVKLRGSYPLKYKNFNTKCCIYMRLPWSTYFCHVRFRQF